MYKSKCTICTIEWKVWVLIAHAHDNVLKDVLIILPKASSEIAAFLTKHFLSVQYSISKGLFARVWMKNDRCKSL